MKKIYVNKTKKHENSTFLHVTKFYGQIEKGQLYSIVDYWSKTYIKTVLCIDIEVKEFDNLTERDGFLCENCELEIMKVILNGRQISRTDVIAIATFTDPENSKKYNLKRMKDVGIFD